MDERPAAGAEYLELVTGLLQRARLADPRGGVWEAADLQWWWRRDQHPDPGRQDFWFEDDAPVAVVVTDWGGRHGCEVLAAGTDWEAAVRLVWPRLGGMLDRLGPAPVETTIRETTSSSSTSRRPPVSCRPTRSPSRRGWTSATVPPWPTCQRGSRSPPGAMSHTGLTR